MQSKTTLKRINGFFLQCLIILGLMCLFTNGIQAQQYINGNLSTGAVSSNSVNAPAGYTWSEVQVGNALNGIGAQPTASLADDFVVSGASWTVNRITMFGFSTNYSQPTSPFTELRFQIFNTDPSLGAATPIYGDLTTNRLTSSSSDNTYRIFNGVPGQQRLIWKLEADINLTLPVGTYWIEWQTSVAAGITSNFTPPSTVVGTTTQPGNNAKQHNLTTNVWNNITDGSTIPNNYQDFHFIVDYSSVLCTGTPDPGSTISSVTTACIGTPFNLATSNVEVGPGISNQWETSTDNVTYTSIPGATSNSYSTSLTAGPAWYRLAVTCSGSGNTEYYVPILISQSAPSTCYCASSATDITDEEILRVKVGTLDNVSDCSTLAPGPGSQQNQYSNYTSGPGAPAPTDLIIGSSAPISIQVGNCTGGFYSHCAVWIDLNQDGTLDASERVFITTNAAFGAHTVNGNLAIPSTATLGNTLMRVVCNETFSATNLNPCGTYSWGETEDYLVNIKACVPISISSTPASVSATCGANVQFIVGSSGDGASFTWQQRVNSSAPWTTVTNGGNILGALKDTLTISNVSPDMSGYQYRALYTGICSAIDFTSAATLTVTPLIASVTPSSASICAGSGTTSQMLQITNYIPSFGIDTTVASGNVGIIVPDRNAIGIITPPIIISGLPVGAAITNVKVKFNLTHTYVGDLYINLVAPNGQVMNLVGALNNGTGFNGTDNFTNTEISSSSFNILSGFAAPRTGTFGADKFQSVYPTNYQQSTTDWPAMFTNINGGWRLAIADAVGGDVGTLQDWSVTLTYTIPTYASGVWSPTTGLFSDAALTIPYNGSDANVVYAAPDVSTDYTVIVNTPNCSSIPLVIPVSISTAINPADVLVPENVTSCENDVVTFTSGSTSGDPIEYQWETLTDLGAGPVWVPLNEGGIYSGTNTAVLTISGVTVDLDQSSYRLAMTVSACNTNAVNSAAATLTVNGNPSISISAAPLSSLFPGLQTTITANATPSTGTYTYDWTYNGQSITGQNGSSISVNVDGLGDYSAIATDQNGCKASVSNIVTITDSLNTTMFVYPNPNRGLFEIRYENKLTGVANPRFVTIYDSKGARVYRNSFTPSAPFGKMQVDLTKAAKGVYYIDLTDASGVRLKSERVVIF